MLETVSLFDSMELDNADHRIAARRALALAHNRVERNLGRFLRGAQNEDEFLERLALVQEDFGGYVTTASTEVGHEHPEHIAAALKDHYRLAVDKVEFEETPTEKQEEEEEKVASVPQISPKKAQKALKRMAKSGRTWKQAMPLEGEQGVQPQMSPSPQAQPQQLPQGYQDMPGWYNLPAWQQQQMLQQQQQPQQPQMPGGQPQQAQTPGVVAGMEGEQGSPLGNPPAGPQTPTPLDVTQLSPDAMQRIMDDPQMSPQAKMQYLQAYERHNPPYDTSLDASNDPYDQHQGPTGGGYPSGHMAGAEDAYAGGAGGYELPMDDGYYNGDQGPSCPTCGGPGQSMGALGQRHHFRCRNCGMDFSQRGQDSREDMYPQDHPSPGYELGGEAGSYQAKTADTYTGDEQNGHQEVTCPACGGDPESVGGKCSKCHGHGKVPNFGDSLLDSYFGKTADANQNNTDLDGPEPKMDKRLWTPANPGEPKIEDGDNHPTKDKDVTEVIGPMRNDHELSEIYGEGDNHEKQSLPTQTDDTPFASNNMEMAPHTKTFNGDGQVDPVTQQSLEAVQSAYVAALNKEAMGMSAQDFRMLADAIRTAPEGADKATLANHVAKYLQGTNPLFDGDRFLQAAMGTPTTQRDTYQLPGEQGGVGLQQNFNPDAGSAGAYAANPLSKIIRSEWPSEQSVTAALLS